MTNTERIHALMRFGYTEREASFICLVALNGGFFLRRQFGTYAKTGDGGTATAFIERLLRNDHGRMVTGFGNLHVYHVFARPIYNAIGQENNRNRRERAAVGMKSRLMGFDFVLDHPGNCYVTTEQERVSYFTTTLGLDISAIPVKEFRSPNGRLSTSRYFIDKYPIFLPAPAQGAPPIAFTFIDEGVVTTSGFESWLHQYQRLFAHLTSFEVVYVATWDQPFTAAKKTFQTFLSGGGRGDPGELLGTTDVKRLADYFRHQRLWDTTQLDSFGKAELVQLRNDRDEFSAPFYKALYDRWKALGDAAFQEVLGSRRPAIDPSGARFSTCLLAHNYDVFGS